MESIAAFYHKTVAQLERAGPKILLAILVLVVAQLLLRLVRKGIKRFMDKSHIDLSVKTFLSNLIVVALQVLVFILVMRIVGVQATVFASIIAGFSVAAGLALSGTLQNFASGVLILLLKPYKVDDIILTQGQEGTVTSIQLFYTIILTFDNKTVIVPNSKLSNEIILNLSRQGQRRVDIELKFKYALDFDKIKDVIHKTFDSLENVLQEPPLRIGVSKLDTDNYSVMINTWIPAHGFEDNRLQINERLMRELKQAGMVT